MNARVASIAAQAKELSAAERASLAETLLESLQTEGIAEVEAAWEQEIDRRVREIESGEAILVSSEDVYAKAQKLFR